MCDDLQNHVPWETAVTKLLYVYISNGGSSCELPQAGTTILPIPTPTVNSNAFRFEERASRYTKKFRLRSHASSSVAITY